jgi:hypothetical protein
MCKPIWEDTIKMDVKEIGNKSGHRLFQSCQVLCQTQSENPDSHVSV